MKKNLSIVLMCCVIAMLSTYSNAAIVTWLGTTSTDWMDSANWATGSVPVAADDTRIENTNPSVINAGDTGQTLHTRLGSLTGVSDLTVYGTLDIASTFIGCSAEGTAGIVTIDGGTVNALNFSVATKGTGTLIMNNNATINATGQFRVPSPYYAGIGYATVELESGVINAGLLQINDHGLINIGEGTIVLAGDVLTEVGGYVDNGWIVATDIGDMIDASYADGFTTIQAVVIPEPATITLLGLSALFLRKRK
jgi:hypothetical protein